MEDTVQDNRAGSCESESWSDGFVQVTQEDARLASSGSGIEGLLEDTEGTRIPAVDDEVDLYGAPEGDGSDEEEEGEGMPAAAEGGEFFSPKEEPLLSLEDDVPAQDPLTNFAPSQDPQADLAPSQDPLADLVMSHDPLVDLGPSQDPLVNLVPSQDPLVDLAPSHDPLVDVESSPLFDLGPELAALDPPDTLPPETHSPFIEITAEDTENLPPETMTSKPDEVTPTELVEPTPSGPSASGLTEPGVEEVIIPSRTPHTSTAPPKAVPSAVNPPKVGLPNPSGYLQFLKPLHPVVLYIIYWCDLKLSGVVLGVCLVVLLTLTLNTLLHTTCLLLLSFMVVSLTYIITKVVIDSFYNRKVQNPFSGYLSSKVTLPEDEILEWTRHRIQRANVYTDILIRLLLFDNIKYSLLFGFFLWAASFLTNYISLLSAMFFLVCVSFSVPVLYGYFQSQIDGVVGLVLTQVRTVLKGVTRYIPLGKKAKAE